jgi:hypothetical protein
MLGCVFIILLPIKILYGVYSPTVLGWIWILLLFPFLIIIFIILTVRDIKETKYKAFFLRLFSLVLAILFTALIIWVRNEI